MGPDDHTVVGRAMAIVHVVEESGPDITLADLAVMTGIPKPTVLRIASDLLRRRILRRGTHGYSLGEELTRLGEAARTHAALAHYRPLLDDLHDRYGGFTWLISGPELTRLQPVTLVCEPRLRPAAASHWPPPGHASLINTAGGHVVLAQQPRLFEQVARVGMAPATAYSPRTIRDLAPIIHRTREEGVAVESEQSMYGWSCAARQVEGLDDQVAVIGVTVPVARDSAHRLLRSVARSLETLVPQKRPSTT